MTRIENTFRTLKERKTKAFISFIMAGDPTFEKSLAIIKGLPEAGVDLIEIGIPFTDPMADGPSIQLAGQRAIASGTTLKRVLDLVSEFRKNDKKTPIILMGYFNPVMAMGVEKFLSNCKTAGVDGLIIVDLPPEEDQELCIPSVKAGLNFIRLATPTSDTERLEKLLQNTSGFVYYVSITGITGAATPEAKSIQAQITELKGNTELPICVGFGVKTPQIAKEIAKVADGVVVGSAIVDKIAKNTSTQEILSFCKTLADATHSISSD
tara:strand:- start:2716 stop:3516 length:801 start_codon:yes stop_codon:yes gene_type:complete